MSHPHVSVGDVTGLISFFEDCGDVALARLRSALDGLGGTEAAQDMIRIRLRLPSPHTLQYDLKLSNRINTSNSRPRSPLERNQVPELKQQCSDSFLYAFRE